MADGAVLETAAIVGAVAPAVLAELVETERGRVFPEGLPSPETAALTLYLGVDEAILPSEMCPHVFLGLAEPLEPGGIETVSVSASPAWDGGRAPQGRRALTANAFLRLNGGLPAAADWMRMRESVLSALDDFLPGLRSRSDFCEFRTPAAWHEHTGRPSGAAGYAQGSLPAFLGWQGFPHATPIAGLFVAGDWTFPGCSVAAVLKGARRTVDLLQTSRR
jgi:phytoene dehydrogenase-like protein